MEKTNTFSPPEKKLLIAYILWEICNLIAIKYTEITCPAQIQYSVMYLAICANTLVTAFFYLKYGRGIGWQNRVNFLAAGLFLTFIADFFLTLLNLRLPGFMTFCLVESAYAAFFKPTRKSILARTVLFVIFLVLLFITGYFSLSNFFGMLNLALLTVNMASAFSFYIQKKVRWRLYLTLGFTLFAGCDYSILVRNLAMGPLYNFACHTTWIFYVPAQVLIVLSYALAVKKGKTVL